MILLLVGEAIGNFNYTTTIDQPPMSRTAPFSSSQCSPRIRSGPTMWEPATLMICGEAVWWTSALATTFMDVLEHQMATTILILLWVARSLQPTLSISPTAESKYEPNYPKATGYGLRFGCFQDIMSMVNGQPAGKSISWKAEGMLDTPNNSEEDPKL